VVIAFYYRRYRQTYRARLLAADPRGAAVAAAPRRGPDPSRGRPDGRSLRFWDGSTAMVVMTLAGLLVPLAFILDQRTYVGAANEQAFGVATAIMAFSVAGIVHVVDRALFRSRHPNPA